MDFQTDEIQAISCWPPESPDSSPSRTTGAISKQLRCSLEHSKDSDSHASKKKRYCSEMARQEYGFAEMALVKWWKRQARETVTEDRNTSLGAYSKIDMIARSPSGQEFLHDQLKTLLTSHPCTEDAHILAVIGSYQEKLGAYENAQSNLNKAVKSSPDDAEVKWLLARVEKQVQILQAQRQILQCPRPLQNSFPTPRPVDRVNQADLSFSDFFTKYAMTHTPVIITGLQITERPWMLSHVKNKAGSRTVIPKRRVPGSIEWAKLENAAPTTVAEYINALPQENPDPEHSDQNNLDQANLQSKSVGNLDPQNLNGRNPDPEDNRSTENPVSDPEYSQPEGTHRDPGSHTYLFDWSLPQYAPELVEEIIIPRYFAGDLLQRVSKGSLYRDSWPSLFIAPAGLRSELHVDTFGSNFWMALLQGKKRWVFFGQEDLPLLYPRYPNSMDPCFDLDLSCPDLGEFPLVANTTPRECVLEAGDVLFVPSGCPHYVENLTQSIAISANYVDPSNLSLVLQELAINGLRDPCAQQLHQDLSRECAELIEDENKEQHNQQPGGHVHSVDQAQETVRRECADLIENKDKEHGIQRQRDHVHRVDQAQETVRESQELHQGLGEDCAELIEDEYKEHGNQHQTGHVPEDRLYQRGDHVHKGVRESQELDEMCRKDTELIEKEDQAVCIQPQVGRVPKNEVSQKGVQNRENLGLKFKEKVAYINRLDCDSGTNNDTINSAETQLKGEHERQPVCSMENPDANSEIIQLDNASEHNKAEVAMQMNTVRENVKLCVEKWIRAVERKGDLKWQDFKGSHEDKQ